MYLEELCIYCGSVFWYLLVLLLYFLFSFRYQNNGKLVSTQRFIHMFRALLYKPSSTPIKRTRTTQTTNSDNTSDKHRQHKRQTATNSDNTRNKQVELNYSADLLLGGTNDDGRESGSAMPLFLIHSERCMATTNSSQSSLPSLSISESFQIFERASTGRPVSWSTGLAACPLILLSAAPAFKHTV